MLLVSALKLGFEPCALGYGHGRAAWCVLFSSFDSSSSSSLSSQGEGRETQISKSQRKERKTKGNERRNSYTLTPAFVPS